MTKLKQGLLLVSAASNRPKPPVSAESPLAEGSQARWVRAAEPPAARDREGDGCCGHAAAAAGPSAMPPSASKPPSGCWRFGGRPPLFQVWGALAFEVLAMAGHAGVAASAQHDEVGVQRAMREEVLHGEVHARV